MRPRLSYHVVDADEDGNVRSIEPMESADVRINGGFFVLRSSIFDDLRPGEDIMDGAARLARRGDMIVYRYDGFWAPMDTMKDKQDLDAIVESGNGNVPWLRHLRRASLRRLMLRLALASGDGPASSRARGRLPSRRHRDRMRRHDSLA